jgi:hypothetical protein
MELVDTTGPRRARDVPVLSGGDLENSLRQGSTSSAQPRQHLCLKFLCDDVTVRQGWVDGYPVTRNFNASDFG